MKVGITGHRPNKLPCGYNWKANNKLIKEIKRKLINLKDVEACTGMALGVDQFFATVCIELHIPFFAFIPCLHQEILWPKESQIIYKSILSNANEIFYVSYRNYFNGCMQKRNIAMVNWLTQSKNSLLIAVWDGNKSGGTYNMINYCKKNTNIKIYYINPKDFI